MLSLKEYITEENHIKNGDAALLAGDYQSALNHYKQHVTGKSRAKDAIVSKMIFQIKKKLNA